MANDTNTPSTWKGFYTSDAKCLLYDAKGDGLLGLTGTGKSGDACASSIRANPTVPFMTISPFNKAHVVFGLTTTGGDLVSTEGQADVFLSPQGSTCDVHRVALEASLENTFEFPGQTADALKAADSTAKLLALEVLPNSPVFKSRQIFAIPPFVGAKFTDLAEPLDTVEALLVFSKALLEYDSSHENSDLYSVYLPSLNFLWKMITNLDLQVTACTTLFSTSSAAAKAWASSFTSKYLAPARSPVSNVDLLTNAAMNVAANLYSVQNELHGLRHDRAADRDKTKGFQSWHERSKKMVLFASSIDGQNAPEHPTAYFADFCKITKSADASFDLTQAMLSAYHCTVQVAPGFVLALQRGLWIWTNSSFPSNLTILAVPRPNGHIEESAQDLVLAMKTETPSLLDNADLQKLTKQPLSFPGDADLGSLEALYHNMTSLLSLLLGEESALTCFARSCAQHLMKNYSCYVRYSITDKQFIRKLLFAFDARVQYFLNQCQNATARDQVDSSTLETSGLFSSIVLQSFNVVLTAAYQHATPKPSQDHAPAPRSGSGKRSQTNSTNDEGPGPRGRSVTNHNQDPAYDIARLYIPTWVFARRDNPGPRDICKNWHLRGICSEDCPRSESHQILVGTAQQAFAKWFNSCK
jgi:hypothetical protein